MVNDSASEKIRVLIVDDDTEDVEFLYEALDRFKNKIAVVGKANNGLECIDLIEKLTPEVVFLDIEMPGMNGLEIAKSILDFEEPPIIVFVTAHEGYAVEAFKLEAVDYIVKPPDPNRIATTIERLERVLAQKQTTINTLQRVISNISEKQQLSLNKLLVKDNEERTIRLIDPAAIIYAEKTDRRVIIHTQENNFPTYYSVDKLENRLTLSGFIRANPKVLVNLNYIDHLIPNGDGSYTMILKDKNNTAHTVSRSHAKELLSLLKI